MKKTVVLVAGLLLFGITTLLNAQEYTPVAQPNLAQAKEPKLGAAFDLTYMSRYISKGTEPYGNKGAFFETISLDLWQTGFGVSAGHQSPTSSGYVDKQRFNYGVNYGNNIFNGEPYKTVYKIDWIYKHYYGRARNAGNSQNWIFDFSWPNILPIKNLSPYYVADYEYPAGSDYANSNTTGWVHRLGLGYKLPVSGLVEPLKLTSEIAYNDGYGGPTKDHDWAYATFGVATKYALSKNLSLIPGLYHQISMDDSVNTHDVTYCKISMKYNF